MLPSPPVLRGRGGQERTAALVIGELQHLPSTGEWVETLGWRFEVVDLDGRRIDKVMAMPLSLEPASGSGRGESVG